jgi:hypothetical protein
MQGAMKGLVVALLLAAPAVAQQAGDEAMLTARDPARVAQFLQQMGYRASVTKQSDGDPLIETAMGGYSVKIFFLTCKNNRDCEDIQFYVGVATTRKLTLEQVNAFNSAKRFARLYLDKDRDPLMEYDLSMIGAGVSGAVFRDTVSVWDTQVASLRALIEQTR